MPESISNFSNSLNSIISQVLNSFLNITLIIIFALVLWAIIKRFWQKRRGLTGTLLLVSLPRWDEPSDEKDKERTGSHISSARAQQMFAEIHGLLKVGLLNFFLPREVLSFEILAKCTSSMYFLKIFFASSSVLTLPSALMISFSLLVSDMFLISLRCVERK